MLRLLVCLSSLLCCFGQSLAQEQNIWENLGLNKSGLGGWTIMRDDGFAFQANIPSYLEDRLQVLVPQFVPVGGGVSTPAGPGIPYNYAANVRTSIVGTVAFAETKEAAIPDSVKKTIYLFRNCTKDTQQINDKITASYKIGRVTRVTDAVKSKSTVGISIPIYGVNLNFGTDVNIDFSKDATIDESKSESIERPISVSVPAFTARLFILETRLGNGFIDFEGKVLADADVVWRRNNHPEGEITRKFDILSNVVPPEQRTYDLRGQIWNVSTTSNNLIYIDKSLDVSKATDCPQFDLDTGAIVKASTLDVNGGAQTIIPLVDGMTINTADVAANVEVRARSYGPGFCAVKASAGGQEIGIAAPPGIWSDWFTLTSHLGKATFVINSEVVCDTGAQFEVRYYK